eukprot:c17061_g1_i1.p2 GENE.c17061_g1_i1~~c17061_g1_i1.p2  ORF type:complete len:152 (+),score=27.87 c17061_g1_i1:178-633(+)
MGGRVGIVQSLAAAGANLDTKDAFGWTALMYAAVEGHASVIPILAQFGASLDLGNNTQWTALVLAAWYGRCDCVIALINAGANIAKRDLVGCAALDYARTECCRLVILKALARTFLMGTHAVAGRKSVVRLLPIDMLDMIISHVLQSASYD